MFQLKSHQIVICFSLIRNHPFLKPFLILYGGTSNKVVQELFFFVEDNMFPKINNNIPLKRYK